jgi:uncharacterized membrane protein
MKKIKISKNENSINILQVLKFLYREGTEIKSLEDISKFLRLYEENGGIEIMVTDESLQYIKEDLEYLKVIFKIA